MEDFAKLDDSLVVDGAAELNAANQQLFRVVDDLKKMVHQRNAVQNEMAESHFDALYLQVLGADFRAGRNALRLVRIGATAEILARAAGMTDEYCSLIRRAAPLHDIGMAAIPDALMRKRDDLTEEEWQLWRSHTEIGARIILDSLATPLIRMAAEIALTHHENFKGHGYPAGLAGEAIPLSGRIVALAEYFETNTNPLGRQRQTIPSEALLVAIGQLSGRRFDPQLVQMFFSNFRVINETHNALRQAFGSAGKRRSSKKDKSD
ncbi:MAG: HD domain-containing protein [Proteobacteria bacterium]|nr:HD domain-containing protein [Pseudomonadota bacterium]